MSIQKRRGDAPGDDLYDRSFDHDACGLGFVCNIAGERSHDIVASGLQILANLTHRGAVAADEATGDGAGILVQMPDRFMRAAVANDGLQLPDPGEYGSGLVFLPRLKKERDHCRQLVEAVVAAEGQHFLGWREIPVDAEGLGEIASAVEPVIAQFFVGRGRVIGNERQFERKLYVIRKVLEHTISNSSLTEKSYFFIPSLSARTMIYKGLLLADQINTYYRDLLDPDFDSALALVHQRYSTNTSPTWDLAQPFRFLAHNGEINTVRGNTNWMNARQALFASPKFGDDMKKLLPITSLGASDSAVLDNALELLYHTGRSLPHAMMMLIPEAWQNHETMDENKRAFYRYHACMMEPWDGPASISFTDGRVIGALLDRNGLRPSRYTVTHDGRVIMASETGVLDIAPDNVAQHGRLEPGKMFLVDMEQGRIVDDAEIKADIAGRQPYGEWIQKGLIHFEDLPSAGLGQRTDFDTLTTRQRAFGYSLEDLKLILPPMARDAKEALGSMGDDIPIAVLSQKPRLLYDYFKQLFAQVTNPPIDPFRERLVTSLVTTLGAEADLFQETEEHCQQFELPNPILTNAQLEQIRRMMAGHIKATTLPTLFEPEAGGIALKYAMDNLVASCEEAVRDGCEIIVLSDRGVSAEHAAIPALLAVSGVHHHLIRKGLRTRCGIVLESGEPREVHHFCALLAYGCGAINPYLVYETFEQMIDDGRLDGPVDSLIDNYIKAAGDGILKVISKMGISTLHSYRGSQIMEAVGLATEVIIDYFTGTPSRIGGVGLDTISEEVRVRHRDAWPSTPINGLTLLEVGGKYQWRRQGEHHQFNPNTVAQLQHAVRIDNFDAFMQYSDELNTANAQHGTLRGLLDFDTGGQPIPLEEVEPWTEIVKRFKTGAMSYGSISIEAHETLAKAMNRLGGKSNSGEGGEDPARFERDADGDLRNSAIKQVASGRFGVTIDYLASANEIQIKMAQGAKPGEGGELPGYKVSPEIARVRMSTPYVGLISPPPHHDIYSIEDLSQLIHDLKNANPSARINVKLVSEVGVGTVAAGVAKGKADVVLVSGFDGGTGAAKLTSIKSAGLPWELGIAETHQTLVANDLRSRIVVECDGQMKTGRDVAVACLLGAEEFGFSTAPLIAMGCIMMRVCHLNTCPVGIATQDPALREKFEGQPEQVVTFFHFVAEELRRIMAQLGFRTINEMVGQSDRLRMADGISHWKASRLDLSRLLRKASGNETSTLYCSATQDHGLEDALDHELIQLAQPALDSRTVVRHDVRLRNVYRTVGTMLSHEVSKRYAKAPLDDDTIVFDCTGSAGQSFAAFGARGITFNIAGDANDYFGKGLSGARLVIAPHPDSNIEAAQNIIIGNVAFYGATSGEAFISGRAGERFCVRNSGVSAVVEGVGDHGCEYMTGGRTVVLGATGRNFAAGMSGGVAYVLDDDGQFAEHRCNREMVDLESLADTEEANELHSLIERHAELTGSERARLILDNWTQYLDRFVKVMPVDYKRALERIAAEQAKPEAAQAHG